MANSLAKMSTFIYYPSNKLGISWFLGSVGLTPCAEPEAHTDDLLHCWLPKCCWQLAYCTLLVSVTWSQCTCQVINWFKWAYCMTPQYPQESPQKKMNTQHTTSYPQEKDPTRPKRPKQPEGKVNHEGPSQKKRKMRAVDLPQIGNSKARMYHTDWQYAVNFTAHMAQQRNFVLALPFQANRYTWALKWFCKPSSLWSEVGVYISQTNLAYMQWGKESGGEWHPEGHIKQKSWFSMAV